MFSLFISLVFLSTYDSLAAFELSELLLHALFFSTLFDIDGSVLYLEYGPCYEFVSINKGSCVDYRLL